MDEIDEHQKKSIKAAEDYLNAKRSGMPETIIFIYKKTYNYILSKL
jgi:hypothetical protein